jgi:NADPH-dependent F420 reductase
MSIVAILGAGNVGQALAHRAAGAGHTVRFGVRDPAKTSASRAPDERNNTPVLSIADACAGADIVIVAVPAAAAIDALRAAGELGHAIVIDATNPIRWDNGPVWMPPAEGSGAQAIAAVFPALRVLKGFNHFGAEVMRTPTTVHGAVDASFAGDDADAKAQVIALANTMGFNGGDAGPLRNAGLLESLAVLWIHRSTVGGAGRRWAYQTASLV